MKDVATPQPATPQRADPAPRPAVVERPVPQAATRRDPAGPGVLEHLDRTALAERWQAATRGPAVALPGRAQLQRRLGVSLAGVRVHTGPAARSLLDHLGARGAAVGRTILLRDPTDTATAAHEAVHTLQARSDAVPDHLLPVAADDPAEREAEAIARGLPVPRVRARIKRGRVALRRSVLPPRDPEVATAPALLAADLPPLQLTEPDEEAVGEARARSVDVADSATRDGEDVSADERTVAEPTVEQPGAGGPVPEAPPVAPAAGEDVISEAEQAPTTAELTPATAPVPEGAPNRRDEIADAVDALQATWDAGAETANDHVVDGCPSHARTADEHPFVRGPPLETPDTRDVEIPDDPELVIPDGSALDGARRQVRERLTQAPARAPPTDTTGLDAEEQRERDGQRRRVDQHIREATAADQPPLPDAPSVALDGDADPARAEDAHDAYERRAMAAEATAAERAAEDFGEERIAPVDDPTTGHDLALDELDVPSVDATAWIDAARLEQIATDDNAGQLPLDEVRIVHDHELAAVQEDLTLQDDLRGQIDAQIAASDRDVDRLCDEATRSHDAIAEQARVGVAQRRDAWTDATSAHTAERATQADELRRDKLAHASEIERDANARATATVDAARTDAAAQWDEVRQRADAKAAASEDTSWFERGIDWLRDQIASLVAWIDDYIDTCRRAINALLGAAAAVAHGIVDAGRAAIKATLDGLRTGLDLTADNLPGELGDIARRYREDIHQFLDGVQADVDGWADSLHGQIDAQVAAVRQRLDETLDALQQGVHAVADVIDGFLEHGLMGLLRNQFPVLAALIDDGLLAPVRRATDTLESWIDAALDAIGLTALEDAFAGWEDEEFCAAATPEEQAESCAAFQATLAGLMTAVDGLLASPIAQQIQAFFQERREAEAARQVAAVEGFFAFVQAVAQPVYEWWQQIQPVVESALDTLGDIARTAWRHIAVALGIDPDLTPLEALQQGLEALWDAVTEAVAPLVQRLRETWAWLRDQTVLASVVAFFSTLPQLWDGLGRLWAVVSQGAMDWLARAADLLAATVLPVVNTVLGALSRVVHAVIDVVDWWTGTLLGALDALLSWEPPIALVAAIVTVLSTLTTPVRAVLHAIRDCLLRAWRFMADAVADLTSYVRTFLDIVVGLNIALLTFPVGLVGFFAGNIWLRVLPACYKPPIINFLLDLAIRFLRFLPEPADFMFAILYNGALGWFEGLKAASDDKKVAAVDLLASIFAGNAELAAGFLVGLLEGVWESTGGTLIFLLQVVGWLLTLPVKLIQWAATMATGGATPTDAGAEAPTASATARPSSAVTGRPRARSPPSSGLDIVAGEADRGRAPEAELKVTDGDVDTEVPTTEPPPPDAASDAELLRSLKGAPTVPTEDLEAATATAAADLEGGMRPEVDEDTQSADRADAEAAVEPPVAPAELSDLGGMLEQLVSGGFTREDIMQAIEAARTAAGSMVRTLARQTSGVLLDALGATGAAFTIGRTLGSIVGQLVVEILLAVFTGGASAGVTAAKLALSGARLTARFAGVIRKLRRAIEPLIDMIRTLRGAFGRVLARLRRWFDDVVEWMQGVTRRAVQRVRRPRRPFPTGPGPHARRPSAGQRRARDHPSDAQERNRRLRAAIRAMRPPLQRMFRSRVGRIALRARLGYWRLRYRLRTLKPERAGRYVYKVVAGNSPNHTVVQGVSPTDAPLLRLIREEVDDYFSRRISPEARAQPFAAAEGTPQRPFDLRTAETGTLVAWEGAIRHRFVEGVRVPRAWQQETLIVGSRRSHAGDLVPIPTVRSSTWGGLTRGSVKLVLNGEVISVGSHESIGEMFRDLVMLRRVDPVDLSNEIEALITTGRISQAAAPFQQQIGMYAGTLGEEAARERAASVFARAPHIRMRDVPASEAGTIPGLFEGPHAPKGATAVSRGIREEVGVRQLPALRGGGSSLPGGSTEERADYVRKEIAAYRVLRIIQTDPKVAVSLDAFRLEIREALRTLYG